MRYDIHVGFCVAALVLMFIAPAPATIIVVAGLIDIGFSGRLFGTKWAPNPRKTRFEESMHWAGYNHVRFQWLFSGRAFKRIDSDPDYHVFPSVRKH